MAEEKERRTAVMVFKATPSTKERVERLAQREELTLSAISR
jgi:hypothetical protein